jgi:CheY-like chemotaxis protein
MMETYAIEQHVTSATLTAAASSHRSRRILVAEDDVQMRRLVATILRSSGYRVVEACDGAEVLERVESTIWADRQDLFGAIVSDMNMPALTGLDVLAALRCTAVDTPFILITAYGDEGVRAEATALGAAAVLDKPIDLEELERVVQAALHGWHAGRTTVTRPRPRVVRGKLRRH